MKRLRPTMTFQAHQHAAGSDYREFPVPAVLASHFLCFWTRVIVGSGKYSHRVLPDGCVDIVFINEEPPIVVGPWTGPFIARFAAGITITGARLRPGYAPSVLGIPASELLNCSIPLRALWDRSRTELFGHVSDKQYPAARRLALSGARRHSGQFCDLFGRSAQEPASEPAEDQAKSQGFPEVGAGYAGGHHRVR